MDATGWSVIFGAIGLAGGQVITAWRSHVNAGMVRDDIAAKKEDDDAKFLRLEKSAESTHTLVNSNMGAQLKISAIALRVVAELRGTPADIEAAEFAEKLLIEHEQKQARVDAMAGMPPQPVNR